jgi:DNA repair exonuclease SbcCD nuclease subunit
LRYLITADWHINESRRLDDTVKLLDFIKEQVLTILPDYLVVLGDIFDKRKPTPKELQVFNRWFRKIQGYTRLVLLEGNHDQDNSISSLTYLDDLDVAAVEVVKSPYNPFLFIYFGHEQLIGATSDNGFVFEDGISIEELIKNNPDVKLFAFGHIHKPQILRDDPKVLYTGSIDKISFSEKDDIKSLWLWDDNRNLLDQIILPTRPMYQFDYTAIEGGEDTEEKSLWDGIDLIGALVKVVYSGTKKALSQVKEDSIKNYLIHTRGVKELKIVYQITDKSKPRNENISESKSDQALLDEYFKDHPNKENLVKTGLDLIKEVNNG